MSRAAAFDRLASTVGAAVPEPARARMLAWLDAAAVWNAKLDLTASRADAAMVEQLTLDALVLHRDGLVEGGETIVDVGTGAGAPGLGLALLDDRIRLVAIEPLAKRVAFLRTVVGTANVAERITVLSERIDPERPEIGAAARRALGGAPTLAMSRATFAPEIWARVGVTLAPRALLLLVDALPALPDGAHVAREGRYVVPSTGAPRRWALIAR